MEISRADHELLFEALALHLGFVTRKVMDEARKALAAEGPSGPALPEVLQARGLLDADRVAILEMLAREFLDRHGGNLRQCLDSLGTFARLRRDLERRRAGMESRHPTVSSLPVNGALGANADASSNADPDAAPALSVDDQDDEDDEDDNAAGDDDDDFEWSLTAPHALGDRFQLLHAYARGGIGIVSVAFDGELQREVALKQIKPDSADDPDSRSRFLLEAEVTGRLEHPGIVPVYGLGFDDQGRPYYAMRFVRGITLEESISRFHAGNGGRPWEGPDQALELRALLGRFVSVCHTMAYAHSRGVLHRDLKPANVLLGPYNETLVVDWGLAKVLGRDRVKSAAAVGAAAEAETAQRRPAGPPRIIPPLGQSSSTDTVAGAAFGTPAFMSPEQAAGELDRLSPLSDVYSLGAMLYTMLCGRPPFEYVWCEVTTLLARVRSGEFTPPRQVHSGVPRALEAVCLKAMANRPEQRYRNAEEMARDIERWLGDEPVAAYAEPASARLTRWGRRHRPLVTGAAVLLVAAVAGLTLGLILLGRAHSETETQRRLAVQQSRRATFMSTEANAQAVSLRRRDYINRVNLANREFLDDNSTLAEQLLYGCPSPLRDWEWSHVQRQGHLELDTFVSADPAQRFDIWSLAFSPDGKRLASGSGPWFQAHTAATGALVVREVASGRELFARRGQAGAVQAVAFSPDGRRVVASAGTTDEATNAVLTCHDAASGEVLWTAEEKQINILGLAYAPDGATIACGCGGFNNYAAVGFVRLRDAATGKEVGRIPGGPGGVSSVAYSPDGAQLALASRGLVDVWDVARRSPAFQLLGHRDFVYAVAFSPDGRWIASGGWDKTIRLWDRRSGNLVQTLLGHRGFVRGLSFRSDGKQLVSCSEDKSVRLWDVATGRTLASFHGHRGFVHCVAFSPDGAQAASGSLDATIRLWPAAAPDPQITFRNGSGWPGAVAIHPDGRRAAASRNGAVLVWDLHSGEELWSVLAPRGLMGRIPLEFTPDGKLLLTSGPTGDLSLYDAADGRPVRQFARPAAPVADACVSPDGTRMAAACDNGAAVLWDMAAAAPLRTLAANNKALNAVAFTPDGKRLAAAGEDQKVRVWDVASGMVLMILSGHRTGVKDVAVSPDGRFFVSVGGQYRGAPLSEVKLWDAATGEPLRTLEGHTSLVTAAAFFPNGRRLATASDDRTIKIWDHNNGDDVFTLRGHTSGVASLAVSRDGQQIVSGSIDCTARVWTADPPSTEVEQVRRRAAVELVQTLFETHMLKAEVLAALQSDATLPPALRAVALEIAARRGEDAQGLYENAWLAILRPAASPEVYHEALQRLEAACRIVENDRARWIEYQHALCLALHRCGRHDQALQGLARLADERASAGGPLPLVSLDLAVRAMASQKLGRFADARAALDDLRARLQAAGPAAEQQALLFLAEAEAVVHE